MAPAISGWSSALSIAIVRITIGECGSWRGIGEGSSRSTSLLRRLQFTLQPTGLLRLHRIIRDNSFDLVALRAFEGAEVSALRTKTNARECHANLAARQRGFSIGESANIVGVMWDFAMAVPDLQLSVCGPPAFRKGNPLRNGDILQCASFFQSLCTLGTMR
jgi:hypothetical protein